MTVVNGSVGDVERLRALARALAERNGQLERALHSRIVIEQAKGVLMERFALDQQTAFELMRSAARSHRIKVAELAGRVAAHRETPPELRVALRARASAVAGSRRSA